MGPLGCVSGRAFTAEGPRPWIEGGFGRLLEGGTAAGARDAGVRGELQLGLDWKPSETWLVHAHGVLHGEGSASRGADGRSRRRLRPVPARADAADRVAAARGPLLPATSLENTESLWQSPYTVTLSALNTWIGEEVRLTGLDAMIVRKTGGGDRFELAGAVFGVNEPAGALLAWRGWSFGDRLTSAGERLPLPPLPSFEPGQAFADQQDRTQPIDDLDTVSAGTPGRAGCGRVPCAPGGVHPERRRPRLYDGQYSWDTRFGQAGLEAQARVELHLRGRGGARRHGHGAGGARRSARRRAFQGRLRPRCRGRRGAWRLTARLDGFDNEDRDGTAEPDDESGQRGHGRGLLEAARLRAAGPRVHRREGGEARSADPSIDGRCALLEVRLTF